jgi:hypothetical protein
MSLQGNRLRKLPPGSAPERDRSGTGRVLEAARLSRAINNRSAPSFSLTLSWQSGGSSPGGHSRISGPKDGDRRI